MHCEAQCFLKGRCKNDSIGQAVGSSQTSCPYLFLITRKCLRIKCCTNCNHCILQISSVFMKSFQSSDIYTRLSLCVFPDFFSALPTLFDGHYCYSLDSKHHQLSHPQPGHSFHGIVLLSQQHIQQLHCQDLLSKTIEALVYPAGVCNGQVT